MKNNPKVLAATYNPVSNTKMFTVTVDIPYVLLPELLQCKELNVSYKKIEDITVEEVLDNPFVPIWTKQQKGMNGKIYPNSICDETWLSNLEPESYDDSLIDNYRELLLLGVYKQNANRLLVPFAYTTCIISGTEWDNFFEKFCPKYVLYSENMPMSFKSKKNFLKYVKLVEANEFKNQYDNLSENDWNNTNQSTAQLEFQIIAEMLYDLYQETN